jgi:YVTN family beta-propeller protein
MVHLSTRLVLTITLFFFTWASIGQCSEYDIINLKKLAIVFGEKDYKYAGALVNPLNDAQDVSDSLKKLGFTVYTYYNSDFKTMTAALDDWYTKISKYEVALFYYSGHGAEVSGENYLFPIDADPKGPSDLYYMAYPANRVLSSMESNNSKFNIMILDACRNNPFTKSWVREFKGGLAPMTGKGSFIGFAASPGTTASDGDRRNGTYTEGILKNITIPNLTIDQIFTKVNSYVRVKTTEAQVPFKNSSLSTDFCFSVRNQKSSENKTKSSFIQPASGILLSSIDERLFTTDSSNSELFIQDSKTLSIYKTISDLHPYQITTRNGNYLYVIDTVSKALVVIDAKNEKIKSSISLQFTPLSVVISPDEQKAYIANRRPPTGGIAVIDLKQNKVINQIPTNGSPEGLVISTDGKYLYSNSNNNYQKGSMSIIDAKNR